MLDVIRFTLCEKVATLMVTSMPMVSSMPQIYPLTLISDSEKTTGNGYVKISYTLVPYSSLFN